MAIGSSDGVLADIIELDFTPNDQSVTFIGFGRLLAIAERAANLSPEVVCNCAENPISEFYGKHDRNLQIMRAIRRYPVLVELADKACGMIDIMEILCHRGELPVELQGIIMLSYQTYKREIPKDLEKTKSTDIQWVDVDWTRSNSELAVLFGITRQAVSSARKRHQPNVSS